MPMPMSDLVRKAYEFSAKAHEGQTRRSGEPYLQHPLAVAGVLTSLKTDVTAIVAGLAARYVGRYAGHAR